MDRHLLQAVAKLLDEIQQEAKIGDQDLARRIDQMDATEVSKGFLKSVYEANLETLRRHADDILNLKSRPIHGDAPSIVKTVVRA